MRVKRSLLVTVAIVLLTAALVVCFAPFLVAGGLRLWAQRVARREGLQLEIGNIEAPLLRPVVIRDLHLRTEGVAPFQVDCAASRLEVALNLSAIFTQTRRPVRALNVEGLNLSVRGKQETASPSRTAPWSVLENLVADQFSFTRVQLHVENGVTTVDMRDAALTGSELEAGLFTAREVVIAAPWFSQTISQVRGATSWQESRLAVGAVSLIPGLDLDTLTIDLAQIGESRLGLDVNLDTFGGKIRARISSDDRGGKRTWDVAGTGSGISLARMSDALEWSNRASGSLHASKFTFRGELADLRNATGALWAEVSGLTWRDRTADTVMIGASLYNREVHVEQLYIKQRDNELTLSGDFPWPEHWSLLTVPAFRGDLSASINDLGEFARLFGWTPSDFAGTLVARGSLDLRAERFGGQLSVSGSSLVLFHSPIESLDLKIALAESRLEITQFELHQEDDFLSGEGSIGLTGDHAYNASAKCSVGELGNYRGFVPPGILPFALAGAATAEWKGRGANESDAGNLHLLGHALRDADNLLAPFDAEVEADYSPGNIFFRQFHLSNSKADFGAFITVAKDYFHLQDVRLTLDGRPRLQGNVYLPVSVSKIRGGSEWLAALGPDPFIDVDLGADALDLAEFSAAVKTKPDMSGTATGSLQISGTPASLQGKAEFHLHDFVLDASPPLSADIETQLGLGVTNFKASAVARGSDPIRAEGAVPFRLQKHGSAYTPASDGPLSVALNFPAIFLGNLPHYLARGIFTRGILSGNVTIADSLQQPLVTGSVNLIDGQFLRGPALSAGLTFKGRNAAVDYVHLGGNSFNYILDSVVPPLAVSARGSIDFPSLNEITLKLSPATPVLASSPGLTAGDCINSIEFHPIQIPKMLPSQPIQEIGFSASLFTGSFALTLPTLSGVDVFPCCRDDTSRGRPLLVILPSL
jgi:hypothetical protein